MLGYHPFTLMLTIQLYVRQVVGEQPVAEVAVPRVILRIRMRVAATRERGEEEEVNRGWLLPNGAVVFQEGISMQSV